MSGPAPGVAFVPVVLSGANDVTPGTTGALLLGAVVLIAVVGGLLLLRWVGRLLLRHGTPTRRRQTRLLVEMNKRTQGQGDSRRHRR